MADVINELFHASIDSTLLTIVILIATCIVYTYSLLHGFKGISILAKSCVYLFFALLAFVLLFGGEARYLLKPDFPPLEEWYRISSSLRHTQTLSAQPPSRRTGRFFTGHTGWYGA